MRNIIEVKGVIIPSDYQDMYDYFDIEGTSPRKVSRQLEKFRGQDVEVVINSGGGDVYSGSEIYTELKEHQGKVTTKVVGVAASSASVIAMAGDVVLISPTGQIMIHNVSSGIYGDHRDLEHESEVLKNYNKSIASAYRLKSGLDEKTLLEMMNKETWLTADKALELKFVDEVMFENTVPKLTAFSGNTQMIPEAVIKKMMNMKLFANPKTDDANFLMQKKLTAQLNLLKLKGDVEE